ncbi:hypothetical protein [Cellulomonas sp. NS3]|uniref:hypothetical protein n=1 Tax=Cellulomonas sp. NS3 TaxID=2973977 RepID=UPI0021612EDC|nr:hypothetical protein [Cellulomonas sp. NS3]
MHTVRPVLPWEIPVLSDAFVAGALARARPAERSRRTRRVGGLPEDAVAGRHARLRELVARRVAADAPLTERFAHLDQRESGASWTAWQTAVARAGADDDPEVVAAARAVWEALGPNAYRLELVPRPATTAGVLEGRLWLLVAALGCVGLVAAGAVAEQRFGWSGWLCVPAITVWLVLVGRAFTVRYRARERLGGRGLPRL